MFTDHEHYDRLKAMKADKVLIADDRAAIAWALDAINWSEQVIDISAAKIEQLNLDTQRLIGKV